MKLASKMRRHISRSTFEYIYDTSTNHENVICILTLLLDIKMQIIEINIIGCISANKNTLDDTHHLFAYIYFKTLQSIARGLLCRQSTTSCFTLFPLI